MFSVPTVISLEFSTPAFLPASFMTVSRIFFDFSAIDRISLNDEDFRQVSFLFRINSCLTLQQLIEQMYILSIGRPFFKSPK
jgi:hypothetical protein